MGILLGLLTALSWGASDFLGRFSARRIGALRTTLYMQFVGLLLLTLALHWIGGWGHLFDSSGWQPWAWGALAGTLNGISTMCLYRAFEVGKMSVVAPVSASYPVLTVVIGFFTGERLTPARVAGIVFILIGVVIVIRGEAQQGNAAASQTATQTKAASGIGAALISAIGFGILFWLLGNRVVPRVGFGASVWMIRLTSSVLSAVVILAMKRPAALPREKRVAVWLLGIGMLDTGAFVLNNLGMQLEQVSVVSVLASLYGAVTVLLAAIVLREHLSRWQWCGIAAIFAGIPLISR